MLLPNADTITAIATANGRGGVGIVRISGCLVRAIAEGILGALPRSRFATYSSFLDGNGDTLDQGVALFFPGPNSYTGEDVLELQGHGGTAVMNMLLQRCVELGARLAQPGEFTCRAFLNNKLDLAQAESVADLIDASTSEAVRSAMRSLRGEFSLTIHELVKELIHLRMLVEAMLDFPEEEVESTDFDRRNSLLNKIYQSLQLTLETAKQGSLLREGAHIVIAGQPNVGKSSLLNKLSGEDVALVSDIPGTTRDAIRQEIQLHGVPLHIIDTAGIRKSEDIVENMGIERTRHKIQQADLILLLLDATKGLTEQDEIIIRDLPSEIPRLLVFNKSDLFTNKGQISNDYENAISISAKTGDGLEKLRKALLNAIGWREQASSAFMARERHLRALKLAQKHLQLAYGVIKSAELFAEELRQAQQALNEITGEFTPDDLLGEIFSRFCIGK